MITTSNGIGLITADEASMAGGAYARINRDYYLYTVEQYWTMSPANYDSGTASMFYVHANSTLNTGVVNDEIGIRPVINLKADTTTTGTGTSTDPFVVS